MDEKGHLQIIAVVIPYVATLVGLYILKNAWSSILLYHFGAVLFLVIDGKKELMKDLCSGWNPVAAVVLAALCIIGSLFILWLWPRISLGHISLKIALTAFGLYGRLWLLFMIYFATLHPVLEELYWRGYLTSKNKYFISSDAWFGGYHVLVLILFIKLPWVIISFMVLSIMAWAWRRVAYKFNGLIVPLLSHVVADASIIGVANFLIQ
ncbi:MAG: hypothetical protein QMD71_07205 [bacterium]|nr:hypothetical protein [bacterium]